MNKNDTYCTQKFKTVHKKTLERTGCDDSSGVQYAHNYFTSYLKAHNLISTKSNFSNPWQDLQCTHTVEVYCFGSKVWGWYKIFYCF